MSELDRTRLALHSVAESLLAGPQYRTSGTIRLRVRDGAVATVAAPQVRIEGDEIVAKGTRLRMHGLTIAALGAHLGLEPGPPGVYPPTGFPLDRPLHVDVAVAAKLAEAFVVGDEALRRFAPEEEAVLWPEHFDVAVRFDEVNYGVSPGDGFRPRPYAYVGVDPVPPGPFWNAPFGAARRLADLPGVDAVVAFFRQGRQATAG